MSEHSDYLGMTDDEFNERVLKPVIAEARRRKFTIKLDPFDVLSPRRPMAFQEPRWPRKKAWP